MDGVSLHKDIGTFTDTNSAEKGNDQKIQSICVY